MNRTLVETAIRNILRIVGAAVAARGYAESSDIDVVVGVIAVLAGEAWSFYEKRQRISDAPPTPTAKTTEPPSKE